MPDITPESPLTLEEVLLLSGRYALHFKDADVCSLVPKDKADQCKPICISQNVGSVGLSTDIIDKALFDARITHVQYAALLAKVKEKQAADKKR